MIAANPAEQRRLLELQEFDTAVRRLQHRRANLPEQKALEENADTLARVASEYATNVERLENLTRQQKRHEDEISDIDARRKAEEGRMYSGLITSERELDAIRAEIHSLKGRKYDLEDALLEIMEQREELESLVASLKERHGELKGEVERLTAARDTAATDIDAELVQREAERGKVAEDVPDGVLKYYEELRSRKEGLAVARLERRTCMGCRLELTAIELEEVKEQSKDRLARCEQCGRILVPS